MQSRLANTLNSVASAMSSPALNAGELFFESASRLAQSFSSAYASFSNISSVVGSLSQAQQNIVDLCSKIDYTGIETALNVVGQIQNSLINSASTLDNLPYRSLMSSLSDTLEQVEPYLPPEEVDRCETVVKPQLEDNSRMHLTLSDTLSILSILLSILFFVLGSMPDDQAERIIQQQNKIIANQEAKIAQLRKEDQALLDTLDSLSDSINLLTDEIELLQDKLEDSDNLSDNHDQMDPGESQQDSGNAQD